MMKLDLYNKKRNFKKTSEPKGKISLQNKNLFVIQKHAASHLHYDFRLELNGVLLSWAIPKGPCLDPTIKRLAMHVEDHPVEYGHFEGIIPKGEYGGGTVMLWDMGKWIPEDENPTHAYHKGQLHFRLEGKKLKGRWTLIRLKKNDDKSWLLIKLNDKYVKQLSQYDITLQKPNSVATGYDLDEISNNYEKIWSKSGLKKKISNQFATVARNHPKLTKFKINLPISPMPKIIYPELATLVDKIPNDNLWLHELKFDGYRILAFKKNSEISLMSRNNRDWTDFFENIVKEIKKLPAKNIILDGEVVLLDKDQRSNFQLLQNAIGSHQAPPFIYYIFDLIYYEKYNLMSMPLLERKNILQKIIPKNATILRNSDFIVGSGMDVFNQACEMGLEGIVAKQMNSPYEEKRTKSWLKLKCSQRQEFVIGGFSPPKRSRHYFGSLYLGYFDKNKNLIYCGNVGTGFTQVSLESVYNEMKRSITPKNPFNSKPPGLTSATWVRPTLVIEVEFSEWTSEGILRHPSFKGLRKDKSAQRVHREHKEKLSTTTGDSTLKITQQKIQFPFKFTNPKKILYPEEKITKIDLAHYYDQIQEWILPYIVNRPLTLVRCPNTYKECFYQKHLNQSTPSTLYGVSIKEKEEYAEYLYLKDRDGLMALIQMGTLEIHPWGSQIEDLEFPDIITFDLDPAPDIEWIKVVKTAKILRDHLAAYHLQSFVKTTGGKGLHVVIPIIPEYDWDQVKQFAHTFVRFMETNYPGKYISEMSKHKRKGKIFIDYLRNQRGATAISPYSTRARLGAPVATPIDWDELTKNIKDTTYNIWTLPKRLNKLKKDPWQDFYKIKQSLRLNKKKR